MQPNIRTIVQPNGKPYLSVIDEGRTIKIRLHSYDKENSGAIHLNIDRRSVKDFAEALLALGENDVQGSE